MSHSHLMKSQVLPAFQAIRQQDVAAQLAILLDECRQKRKQLLQNQSALTWEALFPPLDDMDDAIHQLFSPMAHLHSVLEDEHLRNVYNESLTLLTAYQTEVSQDEALYQAVLHIAESPAFQTLTSVQKKIVENTLRDFRLSGVMLDVSDKTEFAALQQALSQLATQFSEHLLDATQGYYFHTHSADELAGLSEQSLQLAKEEAARRDLTGFVITLDYPAYSGAMKYVHDRKIRETLYQAYTTRASDQGPTAGQFDNSDVMVSMLKARHRLSTLLGFPHYAAYSLESKMAKDTQEVLAFLHDLLKKSVPVAKKEFEELARFAKEKEGVSHLAAWDIAYYSEQLQLSRFHFNQEDLRPYFPVEKVLAGLFKFSELLFGLHITADKTVETWHDDAHFFSIANEKQESIAGFYIDLYARPSKRDGAWMDDCMTRRVLSDGQVERPVAYLTCNFMRGVNGMPALLTHDDVITLFHEFGHCLHHLLTQVDYLPVSGIHGVPWDAVEFPSQFMENFCWDKTMLRFLSAHYETGEPLPDALYEKLLETKHFQSGMQLVRQLEFALFDFTLHMQDNVQKSADIAACLQAVRAETAVYEVPSYNRFQHSFPIFLAGVMLRVITAISGRMC